MMNTSVAILVQRAIIPNVDAFLGKIKIMTHTNSRISAINYSDFPVFKPANVEYFRYRRYEDKLEMYIRDYLVNAIIFDLFNETYPEYGIKCIKPKSDDNRIIVRSEYSNEAFGDDYPFAFILSGKQRRVGYRYSDLCISDEDFEDLLDHYNLTHIEVLDWNENQSLESKRENSGVSSEKRNRIYYVTLHKFLVDYFSEELYREYIKATTQAVKSANQEIGFQTIPQLSLRHLSEFRFEVLSDIASTTLGRLAFQQFDNSNGEITGLFFPLLSSDDRKILNQRFYTDELCKALIGQERFAQCFITSEFLFSIFRNGNERYFDYSAVATGYFKSVELLLEKMMDLTLNMSGRDHLWIKCANPKIKPDDPSVPQSDRICKINKHHVKEIRFRKEYRESFSTEMGALIYFLCNEKNHNMGWLISRNGMKTIKTCLLNYNKGCRNEHLHKDIINNINTIEVIRNNTRLCLYYLLGGYRYNGASKEHNYQLLGIKDDSFDRLYRALQKHKLIYEYYIQFNGQDAFRALKLDDRQYPTYDNEGGIIASIRFRKVDDFNIENYDTPIDNPNNLIVLSCQNMPEKIWWYNSIKGKNEIKW